MKCGYTCKNYFFHYAIGDYINNIVKTKIYNHREKQVITSVYYYRLDIISLHKKIIEFCFYIKEAFL